MLLLLAGRAIAAAGGENEFRLSGWGVGGSLEELEAPKERRLTPDS